MMEVNILLVFPKTNLYNPNITRPAENLEKTKAARSTLRSIFAKELLGYYKLDEFTFEEKIVLEYCMV